LHSCEKRYEFKECDESDFNSNKYEKNVFKNYINGSYWYCIQDNPADPIKATGTQQSFFENKTNITFGVELKIDRCTSGIDPPGYVDLYPESGVQCATEEEIDQWTEYKKVVFGMITGENNDKRIDGSFIHYTADAIGFYPLKKDGYSRDMIYL